MKIIPPGHEIISMTDPVQMLKNIELCGRVCYKSEDRITEESAEKFIRTIIKSGHESVLEHEKITVRLVCDRGVTHEIVRHRIASYSQESTRYCNYTKDKFGGEITFIRPFFWNEDGEKYAVWKNTMQEIENAYMKLTELGAKPEEARSILPNSVKTEIVITMNIREWRHFFRLRTAERAHPQMRECAVPLLEDFRSRIPALFEDIICADSSY
ncbi:MAG: FAD-dependent thymidylate synthase [Ruminococcus sp.]|nr:FAD-dependent thymidylate synthase [Ruminococcus sp.]